MLLGMHKYRAHRKLAGVNLPEPGFAEVFEFMEGIKKKPLTGQAEKALMAVYDRNDPRRDHAMEDIEYTSEVVTPRPITPTFGCAKEKLRRISRWVRDFGVCGRDVSWWRVVEEPGRLPGRVSGDVSRGESGGGSLYCVGGCILS